MRTLLILSLVLIAAGAGVVVHARNYPYVTDAAAIRRIDDDAFKLPEPERTRLWFAHKHALETPRRHLADLGRGVAAAGLGLLGALSLWRAYHQSERGRDPHHLLRIWFKLWLLRMPFSLWYYGLRSWRGDYPSWADSVAIAIFGECLSWLLGACVSTFVLRRLLVRHPLPAEIRWHRPSTQRSWFRCLVLSAWLGLLAYYVLLCIGCGDEGGTITCMTASVILLAFLAASEVAPETQSPNTPTDGRLEGAA